MSGSTLAPTKSLWLRAFGIFVHLVDYHVVYPIVALLCVLPIAFLRRELASPPGLWRNLGLAVGVVLGLPFLVLWLYIVVILSPLSLPLLLLVVGAITAVWRAWRNRAVRRAGTPVQRVA